MYNMFTQDEDYTEIDVPTVHGNIKRIRCRKDEVELINYLTRLKQVKYTPDMKDLGSEVSNIHSTQLIFEGLEKVSFNDNDLQWKDIYNKILNPYSTNVEIFSKNQQAC